MPAESALEAFRSQGLAPFHARFASDFVAAGSPAYWELVAPAGTGTTSLARAIVERLVRTGARRVLVLAPGTLLRRWQRALVPTTGQPSPLVVDRRSFLELEAAAGPGRSPWPDPAVIVMGLDLARRADMAGPLADTDWDLVVIDQSHLLTGQRRSVVEQLLAGSRAQRALLMTATPGDPLPGVTRRVGTREGLVDWSGHPLFREVSPAAAAVDYCRTDGETAFLRALEGLSRELALQTAGRLQGLLLRRAASSSFFAAETLLRRLLETWRPIRNRLAHGVSVTADDFRASLELIDSELDEADPLDLPERVDVDPGRIEALCARLDELVEKIGDIEGDSKLEALTRFLAELRRRQPPARVCVWTSFISTVRYLSASLGRLDEPVVALTSAVDREAGRRLVEEWLGKGGVLITTEVAADDDLVAAALDHVDVCISYDLPASLGHLQDRVGRFQRASRAADVTIAWLRDTSRSFAWEEDLLGTMAGWLPPTR